VANTAIQAKGAELTATLGLDLSANTIDTRLVLSGAPGSGALEGIRPEIALALRGPFDAPSRSLDVVAFTSWLALRAIEEKDKHIEALQSGRELPTVRPEKIAPAVPEQLPLPQPKAITPRPPAAKAAPTPPPTDIRPPAATKQLAPPKQAQPQRPASRSWLENLLGP
jgi:hypothetical protein